MVSMSYIPPDHNHLSPYLVVENGTSLINFLVSLFDGQELLREVSDDGRIVHAEVKVFDTVVMLGEGGEGHAPRTGVFHVYVSDCDEYVRRALELAASLDREPVTYPEGRRGSVIGPQGNTWALATLPQSPS